jgi:hypothetical protein
MGVSPSANDDGSGCRFSSSRIWQESPLSADQVVKEVDGKFRITATVVESVLLDRWLLAYSPEISKLKRTAA